MPKKCFLLHNNLISLNRQADNLVLYGTKPVFGVSEKARLKPVSLGTETSFKLKILLGASLDMILSNK